MTLSGLSLNRIMEDKMTEREIKYEAFVKDDIANNRGRLINCMAELDYLLAHPEACEIFSRHYLNAINIADG